MTRQINIHAFISIEKDWFYSKKYKNNIQIIYEASYYHYLSLQTYSKYEGLAYFIPSWSLARTMPSRHSSSTIILFSFLILEFEKQACYFFWRSMRCYSSTIYNFSRKYIYYHLKLACTQLCERDFSDICTCQFFPKNKKEARILELKVVKIHWSFTYM